MRTQFLSIILVRKMESPRKRSLPSLLGDDYGSSSDDDECETTDKKIVPLSEALTNSSPPETLPVFSNSPTEDAPPKKKKRLRFAHSDLLVTTIHFDSSLPIDPSCSDSQVEDDAADDEEAALASIMAAAQEVEEDEEVVVGKTSFMGIAAPFMDHHGSKSQAPELEHVPAPPKPAAFSFAKSVVTTVVNKKAQHNTPPLDEGSVLGGEREAAAAAVGGSSDASGGLWSMLQPKRQVRRQDKRFNRIKSFVCVCILLVSFWPLTNRPTKRSRRANRNTGDTLPGSSYERNQRFRAHHGCGCSTSVPMSIFKPFLFVLFFFFFALFRISFLSQQSTPKPCQWQWRSPKASPCRWSGSVTCASSPLRLERSAFGVLSAWARVTGAAVALASMPSH
mmetsp:Transcript_69704/g.140251  ORF Transcript_69704/g.140251 Transcript_69704/m.140251 type:complete len:393 (+) Transcript_69704:188-1366(+)